MSEGRVRCAVCGRAGAGRIPKGGDGSALIPYPHKRFREHALGGVTEVWCEGRYQEAKEIWADPPTEED